ncbi:hypothetical protein [Paenibacillus tengchongensis]|uniref:hypothetical protein n=1 Tax=Paenibacillus tengchongensis TaxID=2608684 RepID=UPI00124EF351|nr:hypothetical protein [Paenibacillus tengchongensis]
MQQQFCRQVSGQDGADAELLLFYVFAAQGAGRAGAAMEPVSAAVAGVEGRKPAKGCKEQAGRAGMMH